AALARFNSRRPLPQPEAPPTPEEADPAVPPPPEEWVHAPKVPCGAFVGHALASFRDSASAPGEIKDVYMLAPGDLIDITTVSGVNADEGGRLSGVRDRLLVTGYFKSEMSEYDAGL